MHVFFTFHKQDKNMIHFWWSVSIGSTSATNIYVYLILICCRYLQKYFGLQPNGSDCIWYKHAHNREQIGIELSEKREKKNQMERNLFDLLKHLFEVNTCIHYNSSIQFTRSWYDIRMTKKYWMRFVTQCEIDMFVC